MKLNAIAIQWTGTLTAFAFASSAHAYNYDTHNRIAFAAADAMAELAKGALVVPPGAPVSDPQFAAYLQQISDSFAKLSQLRTGLPNGIPRNFSSPIPGATAGEEGFPFIIYAVTTGVDADGNPIVQESPPNCSIHLTDNLSDLTTFEIRDFHYSLNETASGGCGITALSDLTESPLPHVLGWHAGSIDDHLNDSVIWHKPTNTGAHEIAEDLAVGPVAAVVGSIMLPFACIASWFSGHSCNVTQPFDLANQVNPVHYAEGWMPGFGDVRSDTYTGLWHHIHMDRTGEYNNRPGISYMYAGPNSNPGAFDLAIMAMADMTGLSLDAYASDGDDIYGDLDDTNRLGPGPWQSESIGHIEFSPLDNLALYGWNKYVGDGATSAEGLSWPLHALGDATEPHHIVASTGLGHRPYEDAVSKVLDTFIPWSCTIQRAIPRCFRACWSKASTGGSVFKPRKTCALTSRPSRAPRVIASPPMATGRTVTSCRRHIFAERRTRPYRVTTTARRRCNRWCERRSPRRWLFWRTRAPSHTKRRLLSTSVPAAHNTTSCPSAASPCRLIPTRTHAARTRLHAKSMQIVRRAWYASRAAVM